AGRAQRSVRPCLTRAVRRGPTTPPEYGLPGLDARQLGLVADGWPCKNEPLDVVSSTTRRYCTPGARGDMLRRSDHRRNVHGTRIRTANTAIPAISANSAVGVPAVRSPAAASAPPDAQHARAHVGGCRRRDGRIL